MAIRTRRIISGSPRLENEKKIAENIAKRSEELRASLSTLGKEHEAFKAKTAGEKTALLADIAKAKSELAQLRKTLADLKGAHYRDKREWVQGKVDNSILKRELEQKMKSATLYLDIQKSKAESISKHEAELTGRILSANIAVANRENAVQDREIRADIKARRHAGIDRAHVVREENLKAQEAEYSARVALLTIRERRAAAILAKEEKLKKEEARIDAKGKLVQDTENKHKIERANLARKKARLGRIEHELKNKGAAK